MDINQVLAQEFHLRREQIDQTVALIDEGATIPFIARYRKERTGSLDDQILREIFDRLNYLRNLEKRKEEIRASITEQDKMTEALSRAIDAAKTLVEAEDLYRPYRPKRKTRASVARARGLETLAQLLLAQKPGVDPLREAETFVNGEKEVPDAEAALQGAMDILAEDISDDARLRKELRELIAKSGTISAVASDSEADSVYRTYYDYAEPVNKIAHHRVLALDRGEKEGFLKVSVSLPEHMGESFVVRKYLKGSSPAGAYVRQAAEDSYKRLLFPSVEREIRSALTANAAEQAIKVFASNLRQLLMQPPVKNTVTLGLDPGFRTGCKVAVVDSTGKVLHTDVVHITANSAAQVAADQKKLRGIIETWKVTTIAIGNGTASRESEHIVAQILKELDRKVSYMVVSEAGASVYSASKLAAEEFPDYDVSLRSAVSIARRLQDPLSELVKIDPKAIGVGQYQHDMPKARMDEALAGVVEDCVNSVGVDINTASHSLFSHVAGINAAVAKNIVAYREENGAFTDRRQLLKVPKLGKKAYEQCAGFIRVREGKNPLDNTAVHPESYEAAKGLLEVCGFSLASIGSQDLQSLSERLNKQGMDAVSKQLGVGVPTLQDIVRELQKPGRDVRDELPPPLMRSGDVMELKDLKPGMELVGTVRNVIDFGAFVDIGVHEDGLVHISQICDRYIKHPLDAVKVGQVVRVRVLDVDVKRKRIGLTMRLDHTNQ
ncbi:Tex family protein [Ruminococcus sp.]|uniref:Tex family protein n=1 Tax=Ruminococcus sp. TaxID=41978 RepID=UPI0026012D5B|nr:Tex family protein [Ruminococcus sp.]MCI5816934.1 RNA-binding transcriptional accessory protein [Ruminococcus sp.]